MTESPNKANDRMPGAWKRLNSLPVLDNVIIDRFGDPTDAAPTKSFTDVGIVGAEVGRNLRIMKDDKVTPTSEIEAIAEDERGRHWVQTRNSFYRITAAPGNATEHHSMIEEHLKALDEPAKRTAWNLWGLLGKKQ